MHMNQIMLFACFLILMVHTTDGTSTHKWHSPRTSRTRNKSTSKNRSRFQTLTAIGTKILNRKKNKKAKTEGTDSKSSSTAIRDTLLDIGGQVAITAIGSGGMALTSGAGAVKAVADTTGDIVTATVSTFPTHTFYLN